MGVLTRRLRLPVSYLLKLALADAVAASAAISPVLFKTGRDLLPHFLSDNTSPEILSFTIPRSHLVHLFSRSDAAPLMHRSFSMGMLPGSASSTRSQHARASSYFLSRKE